MGYAMDGLQTLDIALFAAGAFAAAFVTPLRRVPPRDESGREALVQQPTPRTVRMPLRRLTSWAIVINLPKAGRVDT
jgi:hypothetical protein